MSIRYYYRKLGGKSHCYIYSTESREELAAWGRSHGLTNRPINGGLGKMPHYDVCGYQAPGKPVADNVYKADVKEWHRQQAQKHTVVSVPVIKLGVPAGQPKILDVSVPVAIPNWKPVTKSMTEILTIGPELAAVMLKFAGHNRPLSDIKVKRLADKMQAGAWSYTHQGIAFSSAQELLDGQHRLHAVVRAGVPVPLLVTYGLDPKVFADIDQGNIRRSAKDLLVIMNPGIKQAGVKVAVARAMLVGLTQANAAYITPQNQAEIASWYHQLIESFVHALGSMNTCQHRTAPTLGAFCNAVRGDDEWSGGHGKRSIKDVLPHAERYAKMNWDAEGDPMKALYTRLNNMKRDGHLAGNEDERVKVYVVTSIAVRHCLQGNKVSKIQDNEKLVEWGGFGDYGKKPRGDLYTGREHVGA